MGTRGDKRPLGDRAGRGVDEESVRCTVASAPCLRVGAPAGPVRDPTLNPIGIPATGPTTAGSTATSPGVGNRPVPRPAAGRTTRNRRASCPRSSVRPVRPSQGRRAPVAAAVTTPHADRFSQPSPSNPRGSPAASAGSAGPCSSSCWRGSSSWSLSPCGRGARSTRSTSSPTGTGPLPSPVRRTSSSAPTAARACRRRRTSASAPAVWAMSASARTRSSAAHGQRPQHAPLDPA